MKRREFITLLGGAAGWSLAARAQQLERARLVGIVAGFAEAEFLPLFTAFRDKLKDLGWAEGRNLSIEVRLGRGDFKRMADDAGQLIALKPDVILAQGTPGLSAVRQHSGKIRSVSTWGASSCATLDVLYTPGHIDEPGFELAFA